MWPRPLRLVKCMACETGHRFKTRTTWSPYQNLHGIFVSEKITTRSCENCGLQYVKVVIERKRYGSTAMPFSLESALEGEVLKLAQSILLDLAKTNSHRKWISWIRKWQEWDYSQFDECIEVLFKWGLIVKHEKKDSSRVNAWDLYSVFANLEVFNHEIRRLLHIPEIQPPFNQQNDYNELQPFTEKGRHIKSVILQLLGDHKSAQGNKGIAMLKGIYDLVEDHRSMSWKMFSQSFFSSTKALTKYDRTRLRQLLGTKLNQFGIYPGNSRVHLKADFSWEFQGYINHGLGFFGGLSLPRSMIHKMNILTWESPNLLVVENKELYDLLTENPLLNHRELSVLFGSGFVSSEELMIIMNAEKYKLERIFVWPDLDPFGLAIAVDFENKLTELGMSIPILIFGFNTNWASQFEVSRPLSAQDQREIVRLQKLSLTNSLQDTLLWMLVHNKKFEQEIAFEMLGLKNLVTVLVESSVPLFNKKI